MNGVRYFLDANVLLYRYDDLSPVSGDRAKLWLAWLWENQSGAVRPHVTMTLIERAWHWTAQTQVRSWCELIAAAAERMIGSITILDPFKTSPPVS